MKAQPLTLLKFKAWLADQPDDTTWDYCDCHNCTIGSYLAHLGFADREVGNFSYTVGDSYFDIPQPLRTILAVTIQNRMVAARQLKELLGLSEPETK